VLAAVDFRYSSAKSDRLLVLRSTKHALIYVNPSAAALADKL
jgi:hypothetical protein